MCDCIRIGDVDCSVVGGVGKLSILIWCWLAAKCQICQAPPESHLPFLVLVGRPGAKLVSSKGRHLKSFLYPPHWTLRRSHC
jgi:hypothetical protein